MEMETSVKRKLTKLILLKEALRIMQIDGKLTHNGNLRSIGDTPLNCKIDRIDEIGMHLTAPFAITRIRDSLTEPCASTKIHL